MNRLRYFVFFCLLLTCNTIAEAQDQRTTKTKLADILSMMPASDNAQARRLFDRLMQLDDAGLQMVAAGVEPNGNPEAVPYRYAISLLTHYGATESEKSRIEKIYLDALDHASQVEVKAYFLNNLNLIASNSSITAVGKYLHENELYDPAIAVLESLGTAEAGGALINALSGSPAPIQARLIKALGKLRFKPAVAAIEPFASGSEVNTRRAALWALALIADEKSRSVLLDQAQKVNYKSDPAEATAAVVEYLHQLNQKGNKATAKEISQTILDHSADASQQRTRLAALRGMTLADPAGSFSLLKNERARFDEPYRKEVLKVAALSAGAAEVYNQWVKEYKKSSGSDQADLLHLLSRANHDNLFQESILVPALKSKVKETRVAAAAEIGLLKDKANTAALVAYLKSSKEETDIEAGKAALMQTADAKTLEMLAQSYGSLSSVVRVAILQIFGDRRDHVHFELVASACGSGNQSERQAALNALAHVSTSANTSRLLSMLAATTGTEDLKAVQSAVISSLDNNSMSLVNAAYPSQRIKLLPVLPFLGDSTALKKVMDVFQHGTDADKEIAFQALENWQSTGAVRQLLIIRKESALAAYHARAHKAFVAQVARSKWPDEQKLLMLRAMMEVSSGKAEKESILRALGNVRTFLSLVYVGSFLDDPEVSMTASYAAMRIALPTADARPGMTGLEVRRILESVLDKLAGADSPYDRIDVQTYLQKLPYTKGFESIFNGKDLTGWQGLVENPIARSKMTREVLAAKQAEANAKVKDNWSVKDGAIHFQGEGYSNLCTVRPYGDFEMWVDWILSPNGDSGIYLRGSPQVQIWDISRVKDGAQVGSGGLYNNQKGRSTPLVVADNPIGEWNTFYIRMMGEHVTVYLNGILVVDNVVLENYWDRNIPIFPTEALELQAHGTDVGFRNIYVHELDNRPMALSAEEQNQGFVSLFNGTDLSGWQGNKTDYVVEDNAIAIYPTKEGHGNLYTDKEYSNFIFRFQFQLTPGANNGLGIHAPLEGDAAYLGKEIQILDSESPVYAKLESYQYHGSVYGIIPAKRGFLKPTGEWNEEEVYVKGDDIRVTLNGTVILEGNLKKATKSGTMDHKEHPGLNKHQGYIGFLGHGSVVKFRNIRIRELQK